MNDENRTELIRRVQDAFISRCQKNHGIIKAYYFNQLQKQRGQVFILDIKNK